MLLQDVSKRKMIRNLNITGFLFDTFARRFKTKNSLPRKKNDFRQLRPKVLPLLASKNNILHSYFTILSREFLQYNDQCCLINLNTRRQRVFILYETGLQLFNVFLVEEIQWQESHFCFVPSCKSVNGCIEVNGVFLMV